MRENCICEHLANAPTCVWKQGPLQVSDSGRNLRRGGWQNIEFGLTPSSFKPDAFKLMLHHIQYEPTKLGSLRRLPRGIVNLHSVNESGLTRTPTKERTSEIRSDPRGRASRFLKSYMESVSYER